MDDMQYRISGYVIESNQPIPSFAAFETRAAAGERVLMLNWSPEPLEVGQAKHVATERGIAIFALPSGWLYAIPALPAFAMQTDKGHSSLTVHIPEGAMNEERLLQLLRTALECRFALAGQVSLHSACVELDEKAVCFTGPSGTGKSPGHSAGWRTWGRNGSAETGRAFA